MSERIFYTYILTNKNKTVLYVGMINNLKRRLHEHEIGFNKGFSKRYNIHFLVYYETFQKPMDAIRREKEIKKWRREKKENLINTTNPKWDFLNEIIKGSL